MVCIIDDRKDVWNFVPNLVHIKPYVFFKDTGDINDPAKFNNPEASKSAAVAKKTEAEVSESKGEEDGKAKKKNKDKKNPVVVERKEVPRDMEILEAAAEEKDSDHEKDRESVKSEEEKQVSEDLELSDDDSDSDSEKKRDDDDDDEGSGSSLEDDLEEQEDMDDYLRHLQDILKTIHTAYYELYDQVLEEQRQRRKKSSSSSSSEEKKGEEALLDSRHLLPDLKTVIPYVRRKTLSGVTMVLSGVDPMNVPPEKSKARSVARSLGAVVAESIRAGETTHLVAARLGTAKVNEAKKAGNVHVVTPDWLWCCAERWEKVDERLFPLTKTSKATLKPPAHCTSSEIPGQQVQVLPLSPPPHAGQPPGSAFLHRSLSTSSDTLPETMNPMLAFSTEELKGMGDEVAGSSDSEDEEDSEDSSSKEEAKVASAAGGLGGVIKGESSKLF